MENKALEEAKQNAQNEAEVAENLKKLEEYKERIKTSYNSILGLLDGFTVGECTQILDTLKNEVNRQRFLAQEREVKVD